MNYELTLHLHFFTCFCPNPVNFMYTTRLFVSQKLCSFSLAFQFHLYPPQVLAALSQSWTTLIVICLIQDPDISSEGSSESPESSSDSASEDSNTFSG